MSKKKADAPAEVQQPQQPAYVAELLEKGTTVITAKTREELATMLDNLTIPCRYAAGAIGKNRDTGIFSLRLDLVK